jgi:hypothetical protein
VIQLQNFVQIPQSWRINFQFDHLGRKSSEWIAACNALNRARRAWFAYRVKLR